jgi:hypothetical protein
MYVGVIHRITDKAVWDQKIAEFEGAELPAGLANPISYIGANYDYAFCLWDAPSVKALQPTLDGLTEGAAENTYFPVDPNAPGTDGIPSVDLRQATPASTG